jgi:hypothetical protein
MKPYYMADEVAARTADAYMANDYGEREWRRVARWLFDADYDASEIEAILRSKYMRWSSDHSGGKCTLAAFKGFHDASPTLFRPHDIRELVDGTFPAAARNTVNRLVSSLAPYVSGDDIALDRKMFLTYVRDRIDSDLEAMKRA